MFRAISFFISLILLCSLCAACCSANVLSKPLAPTDLVKITDDATVALVFSSKAAEDPETFPFCTGVWVSQDVIITAAHCPAGLAKIETTEKLVLLFKALVEGNDPGTPDLSEINPIGLAVPFIMQDEAVNIGQEPTNKHVATVFALYKHMDIALLRVEDGGTLHHGVAKLASERPERGEQLAFDGHVSRHYWTFRVGVVSAYRDDMSEVLDGDAKELEGPFMQVSAPVSSGDSGGGAFNNKGELVGIASFINESVPNSGFYVPIETIRGVLQAQGVIPIVLNLDPSAADPKEFRLKK